MSSNKKIAKVMKDIKEASEINPNPRWVNFKFNTSFFAPGILMADEEKRILLKLEKEGIIKIHLPTTEGGDVESYIGTFTPAEFMMKHNFTLLEVMPSFSRKFLLYQVYLFQTSWWNYINPFWWLWKIIKVTYSLFLWLLDNKLLAFVVLVLTLLAIDYSLAWANAKFILYLLKII